MIKCIMQNIKKYAILKYMAKTKKTKTTKIPIDRAYVWDYDLPKNWQPKTDADWLWLLERKINYGDFRGLKATIIKKYFQKLKRRLDLGKKIMLENYFLAYDI